MQAYESKIHHEEEKLIKQELESKGMEFIEVDRSAFSKASEEALYQSLSPEMQNIYNSIQELSE